jgi:hypothetical protein
MLLVLQKQEPSKKEVPQNLVQHLQLAVLPKKATDKIYILNQSLAQSQIKNFDCSRLFAFNSILF